MKLRFMRIGLNIEAVTDSHIMKVNSVILNESCLVIGISVSGQTDDIISSLKSAHQQGVYTLLMTARQDRSYQEFCDETLIFASMEHLEYGNIISPQFPILLVMPIISRLTEAKKRPCINTPYRHFSPSDQIAYYCHRKYICSK